jgi:hypothetical protein
VDRPSLVANVALDLAEDRRHRVGRKRGPAIRIEPLSGFDQAEARDLKEVVERFLRVPVARRERARERQVTPHELVARAAVAGLPAAGELAGI